ncbi:MAG TPA: hypothetical protein VNM15_05245 [Candidatus Binatia bacterium]|nr:hypothetical protein [Candidatus Binatia bacterium]
MRERFSLYDGAVTLEFDRTKHAYFEGGERLDSVTGILGVLAKPKLVPWAVGQTCAHIAGKLGAGVKLDELQIRRILAEARLAHVVERDAAADIGTIVHLFAEQWIRGFNPALPADPKARNGAQAFLRWIGAHRVEFKHCERPIFSRRHRYAGTMDLEAVIDGRLAIGDFKTSAAIWPEMRFQTAAYEMARREEEGIDYGPRWILRFDTETGMFEAKPLPVEDLEKDFAAFLGAQAASRRLRELKNEHRG